MCPILKSLREQNLIGDKAVQFLREKLNRQLSQFELDIANFPRVCCVCGIANPPDQLKNCKNCFCVAFCPKCLEFKEEHEKWCKALKIAAEDYKNEQTIGHQVSFVGMVSWVGNHVGFLSFSDSKCCWVHTF